MNLEEGIIAVIVGVIATWLARQTNADGSKDVDPNVEAIKSSITNIIHVTNTVPDSALKSAGTNSVTRLSGLVSVATDAAVQEAIKTAERYSALVASEKASRTPTKDDENNERDLTTSDLASTLSGVGNDAAAVSRVLDYPRDGPVILPVYFLDNSTTDGSPNALQIRKLRETIYKSDTYWYSRVYLYMPLTSDVYVHFFFQEKEGLGYQSTLQMTQESRMKNIYFAILTTNRKRPPPFPQAMDGTLTLLFSSDPFNTDDVVRLTETATRYGVKVPPYDKDSKPLIIFQYDKTLIPPGAHEKGNGWDYTNE
jgi:hypothetical protein